MAPRLKEVTREFALGVTTLGTWREAARAESADRRLADEVLRLISDWENTAWPDMTRARNELRAGAERLAPAPLGSSVEEEKKAKKDPTATMYEAGLRGQRRHI